MTLVLSPCQTKNLLACYEIYKRISTMIAIAPNPAILEIDLDPGAALRGGAAVQVAVALGNLSAPAVIGT